MSSGLEAGLAVAAVTGPGANERRARRGGADDPDRLKREFAAKLAPRVIDVRNRRRQIDEEDLNSYYAWIGKRVRFNYNSDTFKHYIPAARRAIERSVTRVVQMILPNDEFFECYPGDELSLQAGQQAESVAAYMDWLLTEKIGAREIASQAARCLHIYRRAILKVGVKVTEQDISMGRIKGRLEEVWPDAYCVDPFSFYMWPETVSNPDEAVLTFEDCMIPFSKYQQMADKGQCDVIKAGELASPEWPYTHVARLSIQGLTSPESVDQSTAGDEGGRKVTPLRVTPNLQFVLLSECFFHGANHKLMNAWLAWNVTGGYRCVRLKKAGTPTMPYLYAGARPIPGQTYTTCLMSDVEPSQIMLNDQINQSEEARSVAGLPPVLLDPNLVSRQDSIVYGARKVWLVEDPNKAVQVLNIPDTSKTSQQAAMTTLGLINSIGGMGALAEGQPPRGMPRGSQAAQNLISLGMADTQDVAASIETKLLTPMMKWLHRLTIAFVPESQVMMIPGSAKYSAQGITVNELMGNWQFTWVGSQQQQQLTAKGQQTLVLFQGLTRSMDVLHQQGWAVNVGPLVKRIWRNMLGERGLEEIVVPLSKLQEVNPAWHDSMQIAQQMQQQLAEAANKPKVSVGLKGELDALVAKALAEGQPVPPGPPGPTASTVKSAQAAQKSQGSPGALGATSNQDAAGKLARVTAEPSAAQSLGGI